MRKAVTVRALCLAFGHLSPRVVFVAIDKTLTRLELPSHRNKMTYRHRDKSW